MLTYEVKQELINLKKYVPNIKDIDFTNLFPIHISDDIYGRIYKSSESDNAHDAMVYCAVRSYDCGTGKFIKEPCFHSDFRTVYTALEMELIRIHRTHKNYKEIINFLKE